MIFMKKIILNILSLFILSLTPEFVIAHTPGTGTFSGRIVDSESGEPVGLAYLLIEEIHFWKQVNNDGSFEFDNIPTGRHVVRTYRLGYQEKFQNIEIHKDHPHHYLIELEAAPIHLDRVVRSGSRIQEDGAMDNAEIVVSNRHLRQNLGMTIAKTLENEPGLDLISMGPAPARPVLRGLGGDRLLLLEDGMRTGDLSATSADHAVSIEPITTNRIEVIRGPEALIYGGNAMGGVINVIRDAVPRTKMLKPGGSATLQQESVNEGNAGAFDVMMPIGPFSARVDFSLRSTNDVQTPAGILQNTNSLTLNGSGGLGLIQDWGYFGFAAGIYDSEYGIPPDPIGGHPGGVDIDMLRQHAILEGQYNLDSPVMRHLFVKYQYSRYEHQEIESSGTIGMEFGVLTHNMSAVLHFCECGILNNARIGLSGEYRDYASGGLTFTPATKEISGSAYLYNEWIRDNLSINGTFRVDAKQVNPETQYFSRRVGEIRDRQFFGFSGGLSAHYYLFPKWLIGSSILRTYRAPSVEELFSEGPHLAVYAYEVGNADLDHESGIGIEFFSEYKSDKGSIRAALFRNDIQNYIFPDNTGERSWRRADLFLYQYSGSHALMNGYEVSLQWQPLSWATVSSQVQYVEGKLIKDDLPLPRIPPLMGNVELGFHKGPWSIAFKVKGASEQNRIDNFETPTEGYFINDIVAQYYVFKWKMMHTFSLTVENVGDIEYRRHLNRVKDIMPEPGRNMRFLYKVFF